MVPKSYKWDSFKTLLYKNSFPKENGEIGACIDSDLISEFVKQAFLSYEEEILKLKEKKMIKFIFRNQEIELEEKDCGTSLDFNGCYLIEIDEDLKPTGRAINGYGQPISFNEDELIIIK